MSLEARRSSVLPSFVTGVELVSRTFGQSILSLLTLDVGGTIQCLHQR